MSPQRLYLKREEFGQNEVFPISGAMGVSSEQIAKTIQKLSEGETVEHGFIFCVNQTRECVDFMEMSIGGPDQTTSDARVVFSAVLLSGSTCFITAHTHPNGRPRPSKQDIQNARRYAFMGRLFHLKLLDSLVVTKDDYFSMYEVGLLPDDDELNSMIKKIKEFKEYV